MTRIPTQSFPLLQEGQYVLKIKSADIVKGQYQGEDTVQVIADVEVVEAPESKGEMSDGSPAVGFAYAEYWSLDPRTGAAKKGSKLADVWEAATGYKFEVDDEIDLDELIGKEFQAKIVVNNPGTRNRTEHGTIGKPRRSQKKGEKKTDLEKPAEGTVAGDARDEEDEDFESIPF